MEIYIIFWWDLYIYMYKIFFWEIWIIGDVLKKRRLIWSVGNGIFGEKIFYLICFF